MLKSLKTFRLDSHRSQNKGNCSYSIVRRSSRSNSSNSRTRPAREGGRRPRPTPPGTSGARCTGECRCTRAPGWKKWKKIWSILFSGKKVFIGKKPRSRAVNRNLFIEGGKTVGKKGWRANNPVQNSEIGLNCPLLWAFMACIAF